jgi:hypothetical protein
MASRDISQVPGSHSIDVVSVTNGKISFETSETEVQVARSKKSLQGT